ncbi:MAG: hypothetical protein J6K15_14860 [Lachnospiraceae bacterium]|nr:hypothetical protein [Lachnospiraceae bacterium]
MKGSLLWKFMYLFCAMAGILAGYGVFTLINSDGAKPNTITKDNTLVREAGDSVFFDAEEEKIKQPEVSESPTQESITQEPAIAVIPSLTPEVVPHKITVTPTVTPVPVVTQVPAGSFHDSGTSSTDTSEIPLDRLPSLGLQWTAVGEKVPELSVPSVTPVIQENQAAEVITYPAKIFGQTPVINRSDTHVSYFEFCYDLVSMMESEVAARGLNMNALMTKFALKALFCGVDIEKLDINAPIPRRLAALCLWLAAQVLNESGCDTSAKSAGTYVTDISGCTASEKKAVAYLYESGILDGFQKPGQKFYPDAGLQTGSGSKWLTEVKKCWK